MEIKHLTQQLLFNTTLIEILDESDHSIGTGTGFVVSHKVKDNDELFLVTNKHIISDATSCCIYLTEIKENKPDIGNPFFIRIDNMALQFFGHSDPNVDISIIPLSWQLDLIKKGHTKAYLKNISTDLFITKEEIDTIDAIKDVLFIGYPNGLYDQKNYIPILRTGTTATPIQLDFSGDQAFLIDASVFPGSSGSPVFLYEKSWKGNIIEVKLIGIISAVFTQDDSGEFKLIPAPTQMIPYVQYKHMIDLGVVFKSHLITEIIEKFIKEKMV